MKNHKEKQLFLLLSRPPDSIKEAQKSAINSYEYNNLNFDYIYTLLISNQTYGFAYKNLIFFRQFPEKTQNNLKQLYFSNLIRNMSAMSELIYILNELLNYNIATIPLKGTFESDLVFKDLGVYPSADIDILVSPENLDIAKDIIETNCQYFTVNEKLEDDLLSTHYHLILKKVFSVELHWNLAKKRYYKIEPSYWWENSINFNWRGSTIHDIAPEKKILYYIFRLHDHCFYPLRFFVLLSTYINQNTDNINWKPLIEDSKIYNMERLFIYTIMINHDLLECPTPINSIKINKNRYNIFKKLVFSGIFKFKIHKHVRMMLYTILLNNNIQILKILTLRLFPSKAEIRLRYNLSTSDNIYIYYILNPILLLKRKINK